MHVRSLGQEGERARIKCDADAGLNDVAYLVEANCELEDGPNGEVAPKAPPARAAASRHPRRDTEVDVRKVGDPDDDFDSDVDLASGDESHDAGQPPHATANCSATSAGVTDSAVVDCGQSSAQGCRRPVSAPREYNGKLRHTCAPLTHQGRAGWNRSPYVSGPNSGILGMSNDDRCHLVTQGRPRLEKPGCTKYN